MGNFQSTVSPLALAVATLLCVLPSVCADIGILSFWVPELYALLDQIESEGNDLIETYTFGGRKFYVTSYKGHNVVIANTSVGISNSAATTAIMLQKFPTIDRLIGSGIAGGVDPSLRVGDVVVPERWALYQKQHFAKELEDGSHELPDWAIPNVMGTNCGAGLSGSAETATRCTLGVDSWNYSFIYPTATYAADPNAEGIDATIEGSKMYTWFEVDPDMYAVAEAIAPNVTLANSVGDAILDYQPQVIVGGNGVAGPTFLDNEEYREYVFDTFEAVSVDMETPAAAHVAMQFGKKFLFFRSLSDLAGGEDEGNAMGVFFGFAAANAVTTVSAFLEALPVENNTPEGNLPVPNDFSPGEDTEGLLGVLSFYEPELVALRNIMGESDELVYGGRKFYRGKIGNAEVVATLTGVSISNAAMTTALMLQLYPGVERLIGGGIAGGINPDLRVGDVVIPERWALYQMQLYSRVLENGNYLPVDFERDILVGDECGGWDGVEEYLLGEGPCNYTTGETSNFGMMFPKTIQTPDPNAPEDAMKIAEGETRNWWFDVDPEMYDLAKSVTSNLTLKNNAESANVLPYTPTVVAGGNGLSGPTFVDNAAYRKYLFAEFQAQCVDMETAAAAHVAFQNNVPFLFFRSLSDLAGADQDSNVMSSVFFAIAAENAFAVTLAFIEALYPGGEDGQQSEITEGTGEEGSVSASDPVEEETGGDPSGAIMTTERSGSIIVSSLFLLVGLLL